MKISRPKVYPQKKAGVQATYAVVRKLIAPFQPKTTYKSGGKR